MAEIMALSLFLVVGLSLMGGFPVAFTLAGVALIFAAIGTLLGSFDPAFLGALPNRIFGIMTNETLIAVPVFVFMGVVLERSRVAEQLLQSMAQLAHRLPAGLGLAVVLVGALMAASTGIVGATVVTMGLISLPTMLQRGYHPSVATGTICAAGTLGQIIPPSIVLVLLADVLASSYQQAQLSMGNFSPKTVSVGELFAGAIVPGLILVVLYILYLLLLGLFKSSKVPAAKDGMETNYSGWQVIGYMTGPLLLIVAVLGSILKGVATPTEAAAVGAVGAMILAAIGGRFNGRMLREAVSSTASITAMVFMILVGASLFSLVFRGFGGDELIAELLHSLPGGVIGAMFVVMLVMFLLGFVLDFIEIIFVVVPIVGPVLMAMGLDPVWLGVMIAVNLQTSFLTPPFGFSLFYLRGVCPDTVPTAAIYRGVMPFIMLQLLLLIGMAIWPELVSWLPGKIYG
jgi:tripartite ATP-independent transporter DctM subunit